jgi:uncharacterized paraquat-inducible protein A
MWLVCPQCGTIRDVSKEKLEARKICACPDCKCLFTYTGNIPMVTDDIYSTMLVRDGLPIQNRKESQ